MTNKQILKAMKYIEQKLSSMPADEFMDLACGDGTIAVLEEAIDDAITNPESREKFWQSYLETDEYGQLKDNAASYLILWKYYIEIAYKISAKFGKQEIIADITKTIEDFETDTAAKVCDYCKSKSTILYIKSQLELL